MYFCFVAKMCQQQEWSGNSFVATGVDYHKTSSLRTVQGNKLTDS